MTPADDARAFELVRVQGLSWTAAGKMLGTPGKVVPKSTVRAAVARETVRRANTDKTGVPAVAPGADAGFMARVLAGSPPVAEPPVPIADRLFVAPPGDGDDADDAAELDYGKWCRARIRKIERTIAGLEAEGNVGEAQKFYRTLEKLAAGLRQHEKANRDDEGVMTFTAEDLRQAEIDLLDKSEAIESVGLVCCECGRKMRRAAAEGDG